MMLRFLLDAMGCVVLRRRRALLLALVAALSLPAQAQKAVRIAAGYAHNLELREDGTVWAWGRNSSGQLGDGSTTSRSSPVPVTGLSGVVEIAAGNDHSLARRQDGTVWAWGDNSGGQLGDGSRTTKSSPVQVIGLSGVVEIAAGFEHSLARRQDGTVWAWGINWIGQQGGGSTGRSSPVPVAGLTGVVEIAAGGLHALARKQDGTVWAWGDNASGQLGDGSTTTRSSPVQVIGLGGVVEIAAGGDQSLARKQDGTVWAWGWNNSGQLSDGSETTRSSPVQVIGLSGVVEIAAGREHSLARKQDTTVWALGYGGIGLTGAVEIAAGGLHSLARKQDGTVWAWGDNASGQLGDGSTINSATPVPVSGLTGVIELSTSSCHSLARKQDGTVLAWGKNAYGQLGDGSTTSRSSPVLVTGLSDVVEIAAVSGWLCFSLARKQDGTVWAWGANSDGQLGDGSATSRSSPIRVTGLSDVVEIAAGFDHSLARRQDGTVWTWGNNRAGQLGDGSQTSRSSPLPVTGLSGVVEIAAGNARSLARKRDGTVWAWGFVPSPDGSNGLSPVQVAGLFDVVQIAADGLYLLARKQDGTVWEWDDNRAGQLGDSSTTNGLSPVQVPGLSGVVDIAVGSEHSLARKQDGTVWAWGTHAGLAGETTVKPVEVPWLKDIEMVASGGAHSFAFAKSGRLLAWGDNRLGQLGIPGPQNSSIPKQVLDPMLPANTQGAYPVVEYENKAIIGGRYFITNQMEETKALDGLGIAGGFERSGRAWRAWPSTSDIPAGVVAKPVYRFYVPGPNSHFYTLSEGERDLLINYNANLNPKVHQYEGAKFYALQPSGSGTAATCPANTYPVYRAFNNKVTTNQGNHRITSNYIDIFRGVRFFGWTDEGTVFCSPIANINGGDLHAYHTFPGDSVIAGRPMTAECLYNNAGPGNAPGATMHCALPHQVNWTLSCTAKNGATCPPMGNPSINADGTLTQNNLREGINLPSFPAGGIIHITATASAPANSAELIFASAIAQPSGAPDPVASNNISAGLSKTVVKSQTDCIVSLSATSLAISATDTQARQISLKAPAGCAWTITNVAAAPASSFVTVSPTSGNGDATLTLSTSANGNTSAGRAAQITATASTAASTNPNKTALLVVTQAAAPAVVASPATDPGCSSLALNRNNERQGDNIINGSVGLLTATTSCTWSATSDQSWVVITQGATGKGAGNVSYQLQANPTNQERTAKINVKGAANTTTATLTIIQSSPNTNLVTTGGAEGGGGDGGGDGGGSGGSGGEGGAPG